LHDFILIFLHALPYHLSETFVFLGERHFFTLVDIIRHCEFLERKNEAINVEKILAQNIEILSFMYIPDVIALDLLFIVFTRRLTKFSSMNFNIFEI